MNPPLTSNKPTTTACSLTSLVQYYKNNILPGTMRHLQNIRNIITSTKYTDTQKARTLLIGGLGFKPGCHQWYLKMKKHLTLLNSMISSIVSPKPWNISRCMYHSFEDVYKDIHNCLARPYICQLTIYDITFRLLYALGATQLYPQNKLYVHALPLLAYQWICTIKKNLPLVKKNAAIPFSGTVQQVFLPLNSWEAEDFLCHIGKAIRAIQKKTKKTLNQISVAEVLAEFQCHSQQKVNTKSCGGCHI